MKNEHQEKNNQILKTGLLTHTHTQVYTISSDLYFPSKIHVKVNPTLTPNATDCSITNITFKIKSFLITL